MSQITKNLHEYANDMLMMYFALRDEEELKCNNSYARRLASPYVIQAVNFNCSKVEPYATLVDKASERVTLENEANIDPIHQQGNDITYG